ncbi:MAG: phosphatidylserine decarboxylase [Lachnospiraceae bacterium]|nr:phosphatidylserine decarboxylase [Lachnospiraceae bacterium]
MELNAYKDRNGNIIKKKLKSGKAIDFLYNNSFGRGCLKVLSSVTLANIERAFLNSRISTLIIDPFIKKNEVDLRDYIPRKYKSFNDFFTRQVKENRRPVSDDPDALISPSDGRISVYRINSDSVFKIKNSLYNIESLTGSKKLADYYKNGWFILVRLCVDNYHRYCYAADGMKSMDIRINGTLNTVNPMVYDFADVYTENTRQYCTIYRKGGVKVTQIEVGAMGVGRITNHHPEEADVKRGEEKGYFEFGGSSIVLLLPNRGFEPEIDFVLNTAIGYETEVKYGEKIGSFNKG